ncbi:transmembrane protein 106A [Astyanax mexicanus]|uniref:Transmembrane protein 106A n=2 Tax=Astyanax mexicanus TaxID=7994 RepID=A0A8B9JRN6_ASTMX|nr:transmembrane protein 106A [Astyanax mexicanus]XP_022524638.1 transmembrane protein 106A [Astyanax mexicanus]KAG9267813.1 transmembrane protein 106A [Astyanax mexicanus]
MSQNKEKGKRRLSKWMDYGTINGEGEWDLCPTCQGTGRIPRGEEAQLVAVIPCSDQRLKPRHTKLYVSISIILCLLTCSLILFFLFPRSVEVSQVTLQSSMVYFTTDDVEMIITNKLNISNQNFVTIQVHDLDLQALIYETVVGNNKTTNVTSVLPRSEKTLTVVTTIHITDPGLNSYCKSTSFRIHTLFLHLQLTIKVSYLSHAEQLSTDTYEYIDCGTNSTIPRPTT